MKVKIDSLDQLFSKFIRLRADEHCEYCSHFHGRRKRSIRWDPENAAGLCFSCHRYLGENPYAHVEWFKKRLGSQRLEELNQRAQTPRKIDREVVKVNLQKMIELLGASK